MPNKAKSVTIYDVAHLAGVSKSTVSLVLTQSSKVAAKSKQKVLNAIDELGYVYNRDAAAMRSGRSNLVAVVIDDLTNPLMAELAAHLEQQLNSAHFQTIIVSSNNSVECQTNTINNLKEYNVAAFIVCPVANSCAQWLDKLASHYNVITLMREVPYSAAPCVLPDYNKAGHLVTSTLLTNTPNTVIFIGDNSQTSKAQAAGFISACEQKKVTEYCVITHAENSVLQAKQLFKETLVNQPHISAVVCANDIIAHGVLAAAAHLLTSIVSCQHVPVHTGLGYTFTCAVLNTQEVAKRSLLVLQEQLQNNTAPVKTLVNVNLQIRETH